MLRNLVTGVMQRVSPPPTVTNCGPPDAGSHKPSLDWSGRKVVYESDQALTPEDRDASSDVFLFDGGQGRTMRVSQSLGTNLDGNGDSAQPAISGDGNVVSFRSAARNLESREPDNNETEDIYVRRLDQPLLRRISRNRRGDQANQTSRSPALNYNGTQVAFDTDATNLGLGTGDNQLLDTNAAGDVYQSNNPTTAEVVFRAGF
jgi:Tol biopolymer transport system component